MVQNNKLKDLANLDTKQGKHSYHILLFSKDKKKRKLEKSVKKLKRNVKKRLTEFKVLGTQKMACIAA